MSESGRTALLLANADSRSGRDPEAYAKALTDGGMTLIRRECPRREKMAEVIAAMRHEVDCVILAGGDGTMNSAAQALRETGLPLGILPMGTGNDLARTLGVPTEPEAAAAVILAGHTRAIDLGSVNGLPFFNVASVGLTVEITRRMSGATKKRLGKLAYALIALRVALSQKRFSAIVRTGAAIHRVRTLQITVGNGRFYGGGMTVSQDALIDDGMLDVYSLEPASRWSLLLMARAFSAGEHEELSDVWTAQSPVVEVVTRLPRKISADGEIVALTPARFSVLPNAVTVYVPEPRPADAAEVPAP